jgi:hypothetical protein
MNAQTHQVYERTASAVSDSEEERLMCGLADELFE